MDTKEELIQAFDFLGQSPNERIIDKCLELCLKYDITVEDFVDQWSAFNITNLKNAAISLDGILLMERKELSKLNKSDLNGSVSATPKEATPKRSFAKSMEVDYADVIEDQTNESHTQEEIDKSDVPQSSYSERTDSGQIVLTYGPNKNFPQTNLKTTVKILSNSTWYDPDQFRYLHATQAKLANAFNDGIESLTDLIYSKNNLGAKDEINESKSENIICGRILSEDTHKLNQNTIKLEGSYFYNGAKTTILNISKTESFSLFPGQVVAVQGIKGVGNTFIAQKFFTEAPPDCYKEEKSLDNDLQIVVACGPFTTADNFTYEPLQDLLVYVVETKPNVLILTGPFIDFNHNGLTDMTETFESVFDNLIETIMNCFKFEIEVILIPSDKDVHHHPIFPSPSYQVKQKFSNLTCAPNPCLLNINGVIIGASTMDILFHLTKEEISRRPKNVDRLARMASHLINQRSFYPLYPNQEDAVVDYRRLIMDCKMEIKPNILIIPSTLRYCVKDVDGCLFINPERLVKNYVGGTFASISVGLNNISCHIRKI